MKKVKIFGMQLVELSEGEPIELPCETCRKNTTHKPIKHILASNKMIQIDNVKMPDYTDDYIVQCEECGNTIIASFYNIAKGEKTPFDETIVPFKEPSQEEK